jgi:sugar lactone lactonase YvrE
MLRRRLLLLGLMSALPVVALSCGERPPAARSVDSAKIPTGPSGAASGGVARGPVSLDVDPSGDGDPSSVFWDEESSVLYIADNRHDRIWRWDDRAGFTALTTLPNDAPAARGSESLGQVVVLADGTVVAPRFGFGKSGAIAYANPKTGAKGAVPGLPVERRRIGLARRSDAPDGMWGTYFVQTPGGEPSGAVTKASLAAETDYATGFGKPVSVLVHDGKLIVSDQGRGVLYSLPLEGAKPPYDVYASVPSPDTLSEGPEGSIITGQFKPLADGGAPQLRRILSDGGVQPLHPEAQLVRPRGVAYDRKNRRIFVADSNGTTVRTVKILPVD